MAIDLNRFIGTFFDEAREHLESIEEKAMSLATPGQEPNSRRSGCRSRRSTGS